MTLLQEIGKSFEDGPLEKTILESFKDDKRAQKFLSTVNVLRVIFFPISLALMIIGVSLSFLALFCNIFSTLASVLYPLFYNGMFLNLRWFDFSEDEIKKLHEEAILKEKLARLIEESESGGA